MKENLHLGRLQQIVGGELERRSIVRLRHDLAAIGRVYRGETLEATKPRQQIIDNAVNDLAMLETVNFRM